MMLEEIQREAKWSSSEQELKTITYFCYEIQDGYYTSVSQISNQIRTQ